MNFKVMNLCFVLSFVSSNDTDVETTEQFILLFTRYVNFDFSGSTIFSHKPCKLEDLYRTLFSSSVFLLFTHDEFFDAFQGKMFRLKTVCLFQRLIIGQFIRKSCFLDRLFACWFLRESCELLHLRGVLNFFLCFRSELASEVILHGTIRLNSKTR